MYESILHFIEKDIIKIEKMIGKILTGEIDSDDLSAAIHEQILELGRNLLSGIYEKLDEEIRNSISRKQKWHIEHCNETKGLLDVMGTFRFNRTGYKNKQTGGYTYLLDQILGIGAHQKITLGAAAQILEETVMSSYARGGRGEIKGSQVCPDREALFQRCIQRATGNERLWREVVDYINTVYDEICEQKRAHLLDSTEEVKSEIWEALNGGDKKGLKEAYSRIMEVTESGNKQEEVKGALTYFLNNWDGIKIRTQDAGGCWKCCAEGQASHVLSDRMGSRPMGWGILGCDHMAKLRAYKWNGGKIIDMLKYRRVC